LESFSDARHQVLEIKWRKGPQQLFPGFGAAWVNSFPLDDLAGIFNKEVKINGTTHLVSGGSKVAEEYTRKQRLISRAIGPGVGEVKEYVSSMTIAMLYGLPAWL
jgi:hypothetical protein